MIGVLMQAFLVGEAIELKKIEMNPKFEISTKQVLRKSTLRWNPWNFWNSQCKTPVSNTREEGLEDKVPTTFPRYRCRPFLKIFKYSLLDLTNEPAATQPGGWGMTPHLEKFRSQLSRDSCWVFLSGNDWLKPQAPPAPSPHAREEGFFFLLL